MDFSQSDFLSIFGSSSLRGLRDLGGSFPILDRSPDTTSLSFCPLNLRTFVAIGGKVAR